MLEHDRIDLSEGTDINKNNELHKCIIYNYNYYCFLKVNFKFQPKLCDDCHDFSCKSLYVLMTLKLFLLEEIIV